MNLKPLLAALAACVIFMRGLRNGGDHPTRQRSGWIASSACSISEEEVEKGAEEAYAQELKKARGCRQAEFRPAR